MQYNELCLLNLSVSFAIIVRIYAIYFIVFTELGILSICHYLGLGHENISMCCIISMYLLRYYKYLSIF